MSSPAWHVINSVRYGGHMKQRNHDSQNQFTKFTPNQQSISRQHITKTSAEVGVTFPPARPNKTTQHYISRTPVLSKRKNVHIHKNGTRTSAVRIKMFPFAAVKTHRVSASHHRKFISTHVLDVEALHYLTISLEGWVLIELMETVTGCTIKSPWSSIRWRTLITHVGYFSRLVFAIRTGNCCCCFYRVLQF